MNTCNKCKKDKATDLFCENNKQFKNCRNQSRSWREKNKEVVLLYNKTYNDKKADNSEVIYVYAKKYFGLLKI
jgi:hypothetical protein